MAEAHPNSRLETFCDGVFAIALTLLVLDIAIPAYVTENIKTNADFWLALKHILPSIFAFLLSFCIILINWVNHHHMFKLVNKSSSAFIYANGLFLLSIVLIPFPTTLLGENILTEHAAPAVVLYAAVVALGGLGYFFISLTALKPVALTKNDNATLEMQKNHTFSIYAISIYSICAVVAIWFPLTIAIVITAIWIFWLIYGINIKTD